MCLKKKSDGKIIIDLYSDEAPMRVYLNLGLSELAKKKRVVLDVDASALYVINNYIAYDEQLERSGLNEFRSNGEGT